MKSAIPACVFLACASVALQGCSEKKSAASGPTALKGSSLPAATTETFNAQIASGLVLVDFWAPWNPVCAREAPMIEELAKEVQGKAKVIKLNVDDARPIGERYNLQGIPTRILFKDGKEVARFSSAETKAEVLKEAIDANAQ
jgi:thioredoxin 1